MPGAPPRRSQTIGRDLTSWKQIDAPFPRITYDEAVAKLQEGHSQGKLENKFEWGGDLGSPDETYLSSLYDRPVMVHRYPARVKAFYMEPDPQRPELALCVDVLAPEGYGEIIGGSQRMASHDLLLQRIHEHNLPEEAFKWYLDLRKYGSVPHSGFGMGIERAVAWICGLEHVRETIPFPAHAASAIPVAFHRQARCALRERRLETGSPMLGEGGESATAVIACWGGERGNPGCYRGNRNRSVDQAQPLSGDEGKTCWTRDEFFSQSSRNGGKRFGDESPGPAFESKNGTGSRTAEGQEFSPGGSDLQAVIIGNLCLNAAQPTAASLRARSA
jgi:hypothetical protein